MSDTTLTPDLTPDNAPGGQAGGDTVDSLPSWAQKMIRELRTEAATHRTAVTEANTARDEARGALAKLHQRDAVAGLAKTLADPEDLGRYVNLEELVDEAGNPDPGKYAEAAATLALERPHLSTRPRAGKSGNPVGGGVPRQQVDPDAAAKAGTDAFVNMVHGS